MIFYFFLVYAILGAVLSGISLAVFSPFVTLKRISYLGEALSHISFAGIALALLTGLDINLTTLIFVIGVAILIGVTARLDKAEESNIITIFLSVTMALGVILIALKKDYSFDLASYLFGNVLLVRKIDIIQLVVLSCLNAFYVYFFYWELFFLTYNMQIAEVYGIKVKKVYYGFLFLLSLNIVTTVKIAGIILVTAQLVLPSSIAFKLTNRLSKAMIVGIIIAIISALSGFYLSWLMNLPTGAVIVLVEFIIYLCVLLMKGKR